MGKRTCKSKYRSAPSSSPGLASPISPLARGDSPHAQSDSPHVSGDIAPSPPPRSTSVDRFEVSNNPTNIHSPYYLYSSDHPGLVLVSEPLDGNNYGIWLIAMTTSLEAKNKIGFIDGSIPKPSENDQFFKIWCRCNSMLKSWLLNSVSKKIYTSILYIKHASDIWKDLHTRFHKSNLPRLYKLRHQIHSLRQGSLDLSSYHTQTQALWEKLTSIQPPAFTVEELLAEKETNRVIDFLMGLNDNYESIRSRILMKKVLPSLSEIYNLLDQEDSQKDARVTVSSDISSVAFEVSQSILMLFHQLIRMVSLLCLDRVLITLRLVVMYGKIDHTVLFVIVWDTSLIVATRSMVIQPVSSRISEMTEHCHQSLLMLLSVRIRRMIFLQRRFSSLSLFSAPSFKVLTIIPLLKFTLSQFPFLLHLTLAQ